MDTRKSHEIAHSLHGFLAHPLKVRVGGGTPADEQAAIWNEALAWVGIDAQLVWTGAEMDITGDRNRAVSFGIDIKQQVSPFLGSALDVDRIVAAMERWRETNQ